MENLEQKLLDSLKTSFVDYATESTEDLRTRLIVNNYRKGQKVLSHFIHELKECDEFYFSVAFVTNSGINLLLNVFQELEEKGIKGKILTTDYLSFNEPSALRRLLKFKNIETKVLDCRNFHAKGYIFKIGDRFDLIVGSSNLTQEALTANEEWNVKLSTLENGELVDNIMDEFNEVWDEAEILTEEWINEYEPVYWQIRKASQRPNIQIKKRELEPNAMQKEALLGLNDLREKQKDKALLISATGTGKTYLSAFDVKAFNPQKMLFVVHREQIARKALESFKDVFGESKNMGVLSGNSRNIADKDFVFSTIQSLSRDNVLNSIDPKEFDYIIIDEVHRAGAKSYEKIMNYFQPRFLLGMTATPDRMDGYNIYELFDYNIAYEVRLQKALQEDMLCPFHYFGVSEITVDGEVLDEQVGFNVLVSSERVSNVISYAKFYGHSGIATKGLIFCSRNDEARELSEEFNKCGLRTIALSGENTQEERESAIARLSKDDGIDKLDYIFTVDIFNEGVDIPDVNQIIMLRPTQSAVIFVQQLGRGLRKSEDKDFVVVIDFIGNYVNNFLIPIALSGDRTFNKDVVRKYLIGGTSVIPGCSTIMFDRISQERIFKSIDNANFKTQKFLREEYEKIKAKLGRIPSLTDLYRFAAIDPQLIIGLSKTYHDFLIKNDEEYNLELSEKQHRILEFLSREISNIKRPHEVVILRKILEKEYVGFKEITIELGENFGVKNNDDSLMHAINILRGEFMTVSLKNKIGCELVVVNDETIKISNYFNDELDDNFREKIIDLLEYAYENLLDSYRDRYLDMNLTLYKKYSRRDVCRLLNWKNDESATVYGYRIKYNTCPIFVTYKKGQDIVESTKYEDEFISRDVFSWMTRNKVRLNSTEAQEIMHAANSGLKILLFIKKDDDEGTEFYFMGKMMPVAWKETTIKSKNGDLPIVNFTFKMETTVREDIYNYLLGE